jgi:hypothetical protein
MAGLVTRRLAVALAFALAAIAPSSAMPAPPLTQTPDGRALRLTFADEFDAFRPWAGGHGVWRTTFGDGAQRGLDRRSLPTNGELQLYVDAALTDDRGPIGLNPFTAHGGMLDIEARPTPPGLVQRLNGYRFISGVITTQPVMRQTYGYFEMRAELPRGRGLWPAFWLLPADLSWPPEIDVMESIGDPTHVYMTTHSSVGNGVHGEATIAPGFHVFAVSWDRQNVIWYIDGREAAREPTPQDLNKPMFMLANLAVGGGWPGAPDQTTSFPARLRIDYIRAYRFVS